jgi:hypothetical protein
VDKLTLASMALWETACEKLGVREEELLAKIREIDLRDGRLDGQVRTAEQVSKCPACDRVMSKTHKKCIYCGT